MKKQELFQLHRLLSNVEDYFEEKGQPTDYDDYSGETGPMDLSAQKDDQRDAVLNLASDIANSVVDSQVTGGDEEPAPGAAYPGKCEVRPIRTERLNVVEREKKYHIMDEDGGERLAAIPRGRSSKLPKLLRYMASDGLSAGEARNDAGGDLLTADISMVNGLLDSKGRIDSSIREDVDEFLDGAASCAE